MIKKAVIKGTVLITILFIIFPMLNTVFLKKVGHRAKLYQGLYNKDNSYEVLLMGSSHMDSSINPNILWGQHGITSFNYGTGGQPIDVTYYLLKEALKTHNPKVVVVDLYYLGLTTEYGQEGYIRYVLDNMKFSLNKVEAIMNCTPKNERLYYLFPLIKYHSRWKELTLEDFQFNLDLAAYAKGFGAGREVYGIDNKGNLDVTEVSYIPEKTERYLYKFIELSKKYKFDLVFSNAPYDYTSTDNMANWHENDAAMFNRVAEIAEENSIPFINYSSKEKLEEIDFNFAEDMFNVGHENIWGSNKLSYNFADFLNENYDLTDYRGDSNYKKWEEDYKYYTTVEPL